MQIKLIILYDLVDNAHNSVQRFDNMLKNTIRFALFFGVIAAGSALANLSSTVISGTVTFDYSNDSGLKTIGDGLYLFETKWTNSSGEDIFIYNDPSSIKGVALALDVSAAEEIADASLYNSSSRFRTPREGEFVVLENVNGHFAILKIIDIKDRTRGDLKDELTFSYYIQTNGSPNFSGDPSESNTPPFALFSVDSMTGVAPLTVILDASSSYDPDGTIVSYSWLASDGQSASGKTVSLTFNEVGSISILLTVADTDGSLMSSQKTLIITPMASGFTQAELDAAYSAGYADGLSANRAGNNSASSVNIDENLDIRIPSANLGVDSIWLNLEYKGLLGFDHIWKLGEYGYNQ